MSLMLHITNIYNVNFLLKAFSKIVNVRISAIKALIITLKMGEPFYLLLYHIMLIFSKSIKCIDKKWKTIYNKQNKKRKVVYVKNNFIYNNIFNREKNYNSSKIKKTSKNNTKLTYRIIF